MLVAIPPGKTPTKEELLDGACQNPDGFGYAIIGNDGNIISKRTMNAEESIDDFLKVRAENLEHEAMWHCRIATHGVKTVDNCHPFQVGEDKMTYLGHNGILGVKPQDGDTRSDTAIFAQDLLPQIGGVTGLDNPFLFYLLESWMSGSKVVVLTVNPKAKKNIYILNENLGNKDAEGIWWSNSAHRGAVKRKASTQNRGNYDWSRQDFTLTRRWNENTRRMEDILGIFKQGEYVPEECNNPDGTHPVNTGKGHSPYCYRCTMRFGKNLKFAISDDPHAVWLVTRSLQGSELSYTLLSKDDLNKAAQTAKYFHTLTEECKTIGLKTKWAYCFTHDSPWNDVHGRSPAIHTIKDGCKISAPNSQYPYCNTHFITIDSVGVVRDPKVPAYQVLKEASNSHLAGAEGGTTKKQVDWHSASVSDWDDPDVAMTCRTCKKEIEWEYAFTHATCPNCNFCLECNSIKDECLCWAPNKIGQSQRDDGY